MGAVSAFDGISSYEKDSKFFVKAFLLDTSNNLNNWGVTREALTRDLQSFVGQPFVVTEDFKHPQEAIQEQYRKGNINEVGIDATSGKAFAVIEITDAKTAELIKTGELRFVSPSVGVDAEDVQKVAGREIISKFKGYHLAGVKEPAFGVYKAQIKGQCSGSSHECKRQLMQVQACAGCGTFKPEDVINSHTHDGTNSQSLMADPAAPLASNFEAQLKDLSAKVDLLSKDNTTKEATIANLKSQLDAAAKKPFIARILTAKVELGKIKAEEKTAEEEKLIKREASDLEFLASELESTVNAKKEAVAQMPSSVSWRFHQKNASADSTEKLGDKELLAIRRGF